MGTQMFLEVRLKFFFGIAKHRRILFVHRNIDDIVETREHRHLRKLRHTRHEQETNVAGTILHLRIDCRKPVADGFGLGNIIDRARLGYVVDMFDLTFMDYPVFNIADMCIVCGCILGCIYYLWFYEKYDKKDAGHGTCDAADN